LQPGVDKPYGANTRLTGTSLGTIATPTVTPMLSTTVSNYGYVGVPLPLTASIMEIPQALKVDGYGNSDHSAIAHFKIA
jgi:3-hydroxyisobutyrate dehydrogenase-like beta-hydroxyacid dehydrogenase